MLALAGVALLAFAAVLVAAGRESRPASVGAGERSAEALVDSIGVNVHFSYVDTAYVRRADVVARLRELGLRHVRDGMPTDVEAHRAGLRAARRRGIRSTLIGDPERDPATGVADSLAVLGNGVEAFEGPNELDASGDPAWPARLREYMPALRSAVLEQAPWAALIGPSFIYPASRMELPPDLPGSVNEHPYPEGGPPEPALGEALRALPEDALERGVVVTETGYHNALLSTTGQPPVSERAAAVYLPRALVASFGAGVRRTFVYELLDEKPDPGLVDPEQHFGLLRQDLSPKPAFTALRTLVAALRASPGESSRARLSWGLRAAGEEGPPPPDEVQRLALVRADGSRLIALWRPIAVWDQDVRRPIEPSPLRVELQLGLGARDIAVWRPSVATRPVLRRDYARRLPLDLGADLVLVSFR
jgi:hypothetical protein